MKWWPQKNNNSIFTNLFNFSVHYEEVSPFILFFLVCVTLQITTGFFFIFELKSCNKSQQEFFFYDTDLNTSNYIFFYDEYLLIIKIIINSQQQQRCTGHHHYHCMGQQLIRVPVSLVSVVLLLSQRLRKPHWQTCTSFEAYNSLCLSPGPKAQDRICYICLLLLKFLDGHWK